jgi:cytochrome o ubiquinol oxidase subunit 3
MSTLEATHTPDRLPEEIPYSKRGPAAVRDFVAFGFWLFLLSDIVIFATLFAGYAVLSGQTAGGPTGGELFDRGRVLLETACLLTSSFTCGLFAMSCVQRVPATTYLWGAVTFLLGASFIGLEVSEFARLVGQGAGPTRSAFLSAFFALVGTHGLHVSLGLGWLLVMLAQVATLGFRPKIIRRLLCFSLFWHTLDIVWIGVFTIVYLGAY